MEHRSSRERSNLSNPHSHPPREDIAKKKTMWFQHHIADRKNVFGVSM